MDSDSSETNLVITRKDRFKHFCILYWRTIVLIISPLILLPLILAHDSSKAYKSFYVFLLVIVYTVADVLHPAVIAMLPIAVSSIMSGFNEGFISEIYIRNDTINCLSVMMMIIAIEHSNAHRRAALKILLVLGCSHYRLSFFLFFSTMFLSMWISDVICCGLMMPLVKAILTELERMGILEIYQTIGKARQKSNRHEQSVPRPTDFTVFYFLGIAYSSSIGSMATMMGSYTNQIFKIYCETIFPFGPKIEFPHHMLLNLPGVLVMETFLYVWMNSYFLGMFRNNSTIDIGMTEEEERYMNTLLDSQYRQLGKIKLHEVTVSSIVVMSAVLQATISSIRMEHLHMVHFLQLHNHIMTSSPCVIGVVLLFLLPINLDFIKFFKRHTDGSDPLPSSRSKSCLNWGLVSRELNWSVLFILVGSSTLFESLRDSRMTLELERFLLSFASWPRPAIAFIIIVFCKSLAEFAPKLSVVHTLIPSMAKTGILSHTNPHYSMIAATLGSSLPFHFVQGSAVNAMVCAYVHIPPWKMMAAGVGPSLMSILVMWFTVAVWSTAIWTDINYDHDWAYTNTFKIDKLTL